MTADGKIAFAHKDFVPFGSERDREHMMELRATADAVICGATTIDVTETILGTGGDKYRKQRLKNGLAEFPLRVIASGSVSIDLNANIFKKRFSPIIILTTEQISKSKLKSLRAVAEVEIFGKREIDFRAAFRWLREKWKIRKLLCEGGGEIHGALIRADLLDELHLTVCPTIFGGRNTPTIADGENVQHLIEARLFKLKSFKLFGDEIFTIWRRK
jgi:riboflavin-specific deaminase-like protein